LSCLINFAVVRSFSLAGPIYLALVAHTNESIEQLNSQLDHMHSQIISVLTKSAHDMLRNKPNLDLRNLLGGTDRYLASLATAMCSVWPMRWWWMNDGCLDIFVCCHFMMFITIIFVLVVE
jgi:hypothetical protein